MVPKNAVGAALRLLVAGLLLAPRIARADGGLPFAYGILFEPGNASHIVIRSEYWGLFDSRDGGNTWTYLCSEGFGGRALNKEKRTYLVAPGGRILSADGSDGVRVSDDVCDVHAVSVGGRYVQTIAFAKRDASELLALSSSPLDGGLEARLHASADRGDTWVDVGSAIPGGFIAGEVAAGPGDDGRLYVIGSLPGHHELAVARSDDRAETWAIETTTVVVDDRSKARLAGVHPERAGVVFVRIDADDPLVPDALWVTADGGGAWAPLFTGKGDLPGFAFSADADRVFVAGPADGIVEASLDDIVAARADAFHPVFAGKVWGLTENEGRLYAGTDDYGTKPHFMMGVSTDEARSFESVMTRCEVTLPACDPATTSELMCRNQWERQGGYVTDILDVNPCKRELHPEAGERDAGTSPSSDAGAPPRRNGSDDDGCTVARFVPSSPESTATLVVAVGALLHGRRRHRRRRRSDQR